MRNRTEIIKHLQNLPQSVEDLILDYQRDMYIHEIGLRILHHASKKKWSRYHNRQYRKYWWTMYFELSKGDAFPSVRDRLIYIKNHTEKYKKLKLDKRISNINGATFIIDSFPKKCIAK